MECFDAVFVSGGVAERSRRGSEGMCIAVEDFGAMLRERDVCYYSSVSSVFF